jgi:hypothetical protein
MVSSLLNRFIKLILKQRLLACDSANAIWQAWDPLVQDRHPALHRRAIWTADRLAASQ